MADLSPQSEYQQIREEIRAEHVLISNRLTWYVTSQSFLVSAFAISCGSGFTWFKWFPAVLLPMIGLTASCLIFPSIVGASQTIRLWHQKQREFFAREPEFSKAFLLERKSHIDSRGLWFPRFMPLLFGSFWLIVFGASLFR